MHKICKSQICLQYNMIQSIKGRKTRKRKRGGWRERERETDWGGTKQVQKKLSFLSLLSCPYTQEISYVQEKMGESVLVRWMAGQEATVGQDMEQYDGGLVQNWERNTSRLDIVTLLI